MFSASFGPGGFRTTRVHQTGRAQGGATAQPQTPRSMLMSLLPLLILFGFSLLSAMPGIFSSMGTPDPGFSFSPSHRYDTQRQTSSLNIPYHVNKAEFSQHPTIAAELAAQKSGSDTRISSSALKRFETSVERSYGQLLFQQCQIGMQRRDHRKESEVGFLGIGTNWDKVREIASEKIEACEEGKRLGLLTGV